MPTAGGAVEQQPLTDVLGRHQPEHLAIIRLADLDDQVEACRRIFASNTRWTVVRGSD